MVAKYRKKKSAPAILKEPPAAAKARRPLIKWDHRKDKYLLLAVFAQQNTPAPDYNQLSDMLGSETYGPDVLKRRLISLKELATEIMEDPHDRNTETISDQGDFDDEVVISVKETAVQTPKATATGPPSPSSQRPSQAHVQPPTPKTNARAPQSQFASQNQAQTT